MELAVTRRWLAVLHAFNNISWNTKAGVIRATKLLQLATKSDFNAGREITAGQRTMSGQNAELSGQILTLPVILTAPFP